MSYNKRIWANGDLITKERMNNIEDGIYNAHEEINTLKNNTSTGGGGSGEVDLSGYVTKELGNASQITFADGQTFQAKLDNDTLKGEKGDKGDKGDPGESNAVGVSLADAAGYFNANNVEDALEELALRTINLESGSNNSLSSDILTMNYASAHEALPNAPIEDTWKDKPRDGKMATIPTQNCSDCASGTHSGNYHAGNLWETVGQWATIYKIKDTALVENVGVEITDFKMWRYNTSTNQWVLVNEGFDYGAFYLESFWDDGSAPLNDHKILSSDKKTYKCLMDSATAGRCFHPFSPQINWSDVGFSDNTNPCYVVSQAKVRLIKWNENGADNRDQAQLCANVGGDYWIYKNASYDNQWRHNGDIRIGYFKKLTNDWQYLYCTSCPENWDKGFPCDSNSVDSGANGRDGEDGATFTPSVDAEGNLSWTNDKGLVNPTTVNIKGDKGDTGEQGIQGIQGEKGQDGLTTAISVNGTTYTHVDGVITLPNYPTSTGESVDAYTKEETNAIIQEYTGGKKQVYLTQSEYDELTDEQKNNDTIVYNITDSEDDVATDEEVLSALNSIFGGNK